MKKTRKVIGLVLVLLLTVNLSPVFAGSTVKEKKVIEAVNGLSFTTIPNVPIDTVLRNCKIYTSVKWSCQHIEKNTYLVKASCVMDTNMMGPYQQSICITNNGNGLTVNLIFEVKNQEIRIKGMEYVVTKNGALRRVYSTIDGSLPEEWIAEIIDTTCKWFNLNR